MSRVYLKRGDIYTPTDGDFTVSPTLDDGVYQIINNPLTGEIFLNRIGDKFEFNFKLYGLDEKLISHVLNTYNRQESKHNLGVLLNGAKGTGKTVTAKYLANRLGLPVIICDRPFPGLAMFLASINHDCVFFFDEFEKNFRCDDDDNCAGESLLSIMDGVYSGDHCHVFLLTTNVLKINDNLLSRPSRIRYLKSFGEVIDRKILEEYIEDNLIKKEYKEEILDFVDTLTMVTIDIVKSIVDEINLHDTHVDEFKDFFNVKEASYKYYTRYYIVEKGNDMYPNKEKFLKRCKSYGGSNEEMWNPNWGSVITKKDINKFKVGETLNGNARWIIEEIDLDNHFISLKDMDCRNRSEFIYIENLEATPSIYGNSKFNYWD